MSPFCNAIELLPLKSSVPPLPFRPYQQKIKPYDIVLTNPKFYHPYKPQLILTSNPWWRRQGRRRILACAADHASSAAMSDIDMVPTKDGVYAAKPKKVVVLWDLDNKPPRGPPYEAAMALLRVAQWFGEVVDISAYANRHTFIHLPQWVLEERRERRHLDILERKGLAAASEPYICGVCGRKFKTNLDLKKHFRQLHERERQKKLNRMKSLKGKKRQRFKERYMDSNHKYIEAARTLVTPKVGYGLASELRRAGVYVKTVEDKPQAADWALKRQMQHSMSRGIDWLFLVSDDSDFSEMLRRAREADIGTVVVGDWDRALGRHVDLWVPWMGVENGEISEKDVLPRRRITDSLERDDASVSVSSFGGEVRSKGALDGLVDELVALRTDFHNMAEEEDEEVIQDYKEDGDFLLDSDDEDTEDEDGYF